MEGSMEVLYVIYNIMTQKKYRINSETMVSYL